MTSVTKDFSVETSMGRFGFLELEYQIGSHAFPRQWQLYIGGYDFPFGFEHVLVLFLFVGVLFFLGFNSHKDRVLK
jgi:hypothetical protein